MDRFNPKINAVVQLDADRARERAAEADRAARRDAYLTEEIVSANGMPEYRDNVPTRNSDAVQRYVDAGAIVFGHNQAPMGRRTWTINGAERSMLFDTLFWAAFSLVTYLPATVAPAGRTRENLPVGVQIVGPYLEDETPQAVAAMLEEHHAAFEPPPGYP